MARAEIDRLVQRPDGGVVIGASVQVNKRTGGAATVYTTETGSTALANPLTTDAFGRLTGWLDEGSYDLVISGTGISTYSEPFESVSGAAGVARIPPYVLVPPPSGGDDTALIQAAVDKAESFHGARVSCPAVVFQSGVYHKSAAINYHDSSALSFIGQGKNATLIIDDVDLGAGNFSFNPLDQGGNSGTQFQGFELRGPSVSNNYGVNPCNMHGLLAQGSGIMRDMLVRGYHASVQIGTDHCSFYECDFGGWYGCYWKLSPFGGGFGDHRFYGCRFVGGNFAGIGIHGDSYLVSTTFISCHFGLTPFVFWQEGPNGTGLLLYNVQFINSSCEDWGHAIVGDADSDTHFNGGVPGGNSAVMNCTFSPTLFQNGSFNPGMQISGYDTGYAFNGSRYEHNTFVGGWQTWSTPYAFNAFFRTNILASNYFHGAEHIVERLKNDTTKQFVVPRVGELGNQAYPGQATNYFDWGTTLADPGTPGPAKGYLSYADAAVQKWQLLEASSFLRARPYAAANRARPVGVAMADAAVGKTFIAATRGFLHIREDGAGAGYGGIEKPSKITNGAVTSSAGSEGTGGTYTATTGAVTQVTIPHGLNYGIAPTGVTVTPANANARGAPALYVTTDTANVYLNFASALTAATSYSWNWSIAPEGPVVGILDGFGTYEGVACHDVHYGGPV